MGNRLHCAFLTLENREGFYIYDHLAFAPLNERGWDVVEIPWTQPNVDWSDFDAVVIRSTWDYQNDPDRFLNVLGQIEATGTPLFNPLNICRWNLDKGYLRDLEQLANNIVPTHWNAELSVQSLESAFNAFGQSTIVVKPLIGANADDTYVLKESQPECWDSVIKTFSSRPSMTQPFIDSVVEEGEYSLFYFGGEYSHAIVKRPAKNDFRVQEEHGGTLQATIVEAAFAEAGRFVMDSLPEELLYARVDLVRLKGGQPAVIELELIEPSLYFPFADHAPEMFAKALHRMV